jgi:hypothetical protein
LIGLAKAEITQANINKLTVCAEKYLSSKLVLLNAGENRRNIPTTHKASSARNPGGGFREF